MSLWADHHWRSNHSVIWGKQLCVVLYQNRQRDYFVVINSVSIGQEKKVYSRVDVANVGKERIVFPGRVEFPPYVNQIMAVQHFSQYWPNFELISRWEWGPFGFVKNRVQDYIGGPPPPKNNIPLESGETAWSNALKKGSWPELGA